MTARVPPRTLRLVDGLAQLSFLVQGLLARHAATHELSMIQTRLLGVLRDRRPTMNELAGLLDLDKSSASGLVDRAQRRGLVARQRSPSDGRSVHVTLTDEGRALVDDVSARFTAEVAELLAPLAAGERAALAELVSRMIVGEAGARGIDLFDTVGPGAQRAAPQASSRGR